MGLAAPQSVWATTSFNSGEGNSSPCCLYDTQYNIAMRNFFAIIASIFCLCYAATAQSNTDVFPYLSYYRAINRAELSIAEFKYARALHIYDSIFAIFPKRDDNSLYNATLCALHAGMPKKAQQWVMELIARGRTIKNFSASTFKQQPSSFWSPIEKSYDSLSTIYGNEAKRWEYFKTEIDTMNAREQRVLEAIRKTKREADYDSIVYTHAQRLYHLIDSIGIPPVCMFHNGTHRLHLAVIRHHFSLRNRWCNNYEVDTTKPPYCNMDMRRFDIEPLLLKAVRHGDLSPGLLDFYTQHNDPNRMFGRDEVFHIHIDLCNRTLKVEKNTNLNLDVINSRRLASGLETVEDALKKVADIVLIYNQKAYPFDKIIQYDLAMGYTGANLEGLSKEQRKELENRHSWEDVLKKHKEDLALRIPSEVGSDITYNMLTLSEFRFNSGMGLYTVHTQRLP